MTSSKPGGAVMNDARNPFDLSGKVALVTGANSGLRVGLARGIAMAGGDVVIRGRRADRNEQEAAGLWAHVSTTWVVKGFPGVRPARSLQSFHEMPTEAYHALLARSTSTEPSTRCARACDA
jgi:NAD(P)-dependent dehydrogenase (short-subunit alcohol dehydrogenase family)